MSAESENIDDIFSRDLSHINSIDDANVAVIIPMIINFLVDAKVLYFVY